MKIGEPIQIASLSPVPWKNGGGITRNLAVEPEHAGFDHFLWRLSFAEVNAPGRFSTFPGVDRSILVWKGNGLLLHANDGGVFALTQGVEAYAFRGEDEIEATLIDGPTIDFNVMVRRSRCTTVVCRYESEAMICRSAQQAFFLCAEGSFRLIFPFDQERLLYAGESLPVSHLTEGVKILPDTTDASMIAVLINFLEPATATAD
jgi:environmental stress-induced protein Ves